MMKISIGSGNPQVEAFRAALLGTWGEIAVLIARLQGTPRGLPQSFFEDAFDRASDALERFGEYQTQMQAFLEGDPRNPFLLGLATQVTLYERQIRQFLRDLQIVKIDTELMRRMQEIGDRLSFQSNVLGTQASLYDDIYSAAQLEERLRASLQLLRTFGTTQRLYLQAERLYSSMLRPGTSGKYTSAEMEEFATIFQDLSDTYQQLTRDYEDIQQRHEELQERLGTLLR